MHFNQAFEDSGSLTGWYVGTQKYNQKQWDETKYPKVPLILASLIERDAISYKKVLKENDWKLVCWYPSCHGPMTGPGSYNIHLYAKEHKHKAESSNLACYGIYPLSCSVYTWKEFAKNPNPYTETGLLGYPHGVIGLRRVDIKEEVDEKEAAPWFRFATTELATYWAWGLKPGEKNVYALEPEIEAKEKKAEEERKAAQEQREKANAAYNQAWQDAQLAGLRAKRRL